MGIVLIQQISDFCQGCGDKFVTKWAFLHVVCIRKGIFEVTTHVGYLLCWHFKDETEKEDNFEQIIDNGECTSVSAF